MNEENSFDVTQDKWKEKLTEEECRVMRQKGTEAPFSGKYVNTKEKGTYFCKGCGTKLFKSEIGRAHV